jgi:hypothetical protein
MVTMVTGGTELLQDPVAQELLTSRIPARLAYNWTDGTPRVVSIWFHWDGSDLVMASLPGAPKLKALHTGDRVAVTIDTNDPPHHILSIRGTAEVTEIQGVVKEYAQAAVRYLGRAQGEAGHVITARRSGSRAATSRRQQQRQQHGRIAAVDDQRRGTTRARTPPLGSCLWGRRRGAAREAAPRGGRSGDRRGGGQRRTAVRALTMPRP